MFEVERHLEPIINTTERDEGTASTGDGSQGENMNGHAGARSSLGRLAPRLIPRLLQGLLPAFGVLAVLLGSLVVAGGFAGLDVAPAAAQEAATELRASHSNLCLGVEGGSTASIAPITQQVCSGADHQQWTQVDLGDGFHQLQVAHTGMCLNVEGGSVDNLAKLIQYPCTVNNNDDFELRDAGAGNVHIVARHSGKCIDIEGGSAAVGAAVIQYSCHFGANQSFLFRHSDPVDGSAGRWDPVKALPMVPVAASALPDGRVLMWSSSQKYAIGGQNFTYSMTFNPFDDSVSEQTVTATQHDMFCPGIAHLADGRILINGGTSSAETTIYDPATGQWQDADDMNVPRGYNGSTLLADGSAFTVGGSWSGGQGGKVGEVWTNDGGWRRLDGISADPLQGPDPRGVYRADNHMWLFGWTDNRVFHAGPSRDMHWLGTDGSGSVSSAGARGADGYAMNGNAVMYDIGKILTTGGAPAYENEWGTSNATVVDINGASVSSRTVPAMAYQRTLHNSVVLPNGEVVITGGQEYARLFTDDRAIMPVEIWNPDSEQFRTGAPMDVPRTYHSFSLLLPDGRVVVGGGGLCGAGCAGNHPDLQIYTPPYLLNADGSSAPRPTITSAPSSVDLNEQFPVTTGGSISDVVLVRMASATHSVNNDQRRIPLSFTGSGGSYTAQMPAEPGIATPGRYMLFVLDGNGVPSVGEIVTVTTNIDNGGGGGGGGGNSCAGLSREAEDGEVSGSFAVFADAAASGGSYVGAPDNSGNAWSPGANKVDLCFTVTEAGEYRLDAQAQGSTWYNDSFFVTVNGGGSSMWDVANIADGYRADSVSDRGGDDPVIVDLQPGEHTVSVHLREDGTRLDSMTLVRVGDGGGGGGGGGGNSCAGLTREAEDGDVSGSFAVASDAAASGGSYVGAPEGSRNRSSAGNNKVELCFTVTEPGDYRINGLVNGPSGFSDSFFVTVNGGDSSLWDLPYGAAGYVNDYVSDRGGANPVIVTLGAGEHTIGFHLREDGTRLDRVTLERN